MNAGGNIPEPEPRARSNFATGHLAVSLGFGGLAAALLAIRILGYGENWSDRALALVVMSGLAGWLAALACLMVLTRWQGLGRIATVCVSALLFASLYLTAFGLGFIIENRVFSGSFEPNPDRPILSFVFSSLQTAGMFAISVPRYLLPWVLPVLILAAALMLPRLARKR